MMPVADAIFGVEAGQFASTLAVLGAIWAFYQRTQKAQAQLAEDVRKRIIAAEAERKANAIPQPFVTTMAEEFVKRSEHDELKGRVRGLETQMRKDKDEIIKAGEERAIAIHNRLNTVIEDLGEMKGAIGEVKGKVSEVSRKL